MRIDLNCAECGSNRFTLDKHSEDDAHVECEDCGHKIGTLADLKERVSAFVLSHSRLKPAEPN
jgi:DNA-directed RNA polymerase subunit RPC12/RpoP